MGNDKGYSILLDIRIRENTNMVSKIRIRMKYEYEYYLIFFPDMNTDVICEMTPNTNTICFFF